KPLPAPTPRPLRPADGTLRINPNFTFANFIGGDANRVALEASKAFARGESLGSDILLITGDHGLGKSHLTQAIAQNYLTANPDKRVFYLAAEDFSTELVVSLKKQVMDSFKSKYRRGCDLLLLEEFNFFSGKRKFEEEFSHTLDLLLNQGKKIVLTSWEDLRSLTQLSPQLRSKIVSSLFTPIGPPDFETRVAILEHKAKKADLVLSRRVIEFMAEKLQNDVRLLEGCLMTLSANCRFSRQPISLEMAQQCLSFVETAASDELTMEKITRMVCLNYNISETEIISNSRRSRILEAREMAMYLTRNLTNKTLAEIGSAFHRTHSTTLSSYRRIEKLLKKSQKLRDTVDFLTSQLGGPKTLKNG
ncbi:MAG: chromosomal replication initiator protein DnaA, partial [Deltaproteobacteria bacterium]|nr:chromosomal replication initiator protein DnaA [Deltaproteobacteria bacterium]